MEYNMGGVKNMKGREICENKHQIKEV